MTGAAERTCVACASPKVMVVPRGFVGQSNSPDQYRLCQQCGYITYEIVAVQQRDLRLHRYEANARYERDGASYRVRRVLKAGFNEYLLYLQPEAGPKAPPGPPLSAPPLGRGIP